MHNITIVPGRSARSEPYLSAWRTHLL